MRIEPPNYTAVPNSVLDYWLEKLSPAEFKVMICLFRANRRVSRQEIEKMTGLSKETIRKNVIPNLNEQGLLIKHEQKSEHGDFDSTLYEINFNQEEPLKDNSSPQIKTAKIPIKEKEVHQDLENSEIAIALANDFYRLRKNLAPKTVLPNFIQWAKVIDKMIQEDGRTYEEIEFVINNIFDPQNINNFKWGYTIRNVMNLREEFDSIMKELKENE